ncbi:MAG: hypothetical protein AAFZ87_06405 [Planctomycetota bacterium]
MNSTATLLKRHEVVTGERDELVDRLADSHLEANLIAMKALRPSAGSRRARTRRPRGSTEPRGPWPP